MERTTRVGMQELDKHLSRIVENARRAPVAVHRYGAPWVWIVSQELWCQQRQQCLEDYLPLDHPLYALSHQLDQDGLLEQLAAHLPDGELPASLRARLLVLARYDGHDTDGQRLHDVLGYNLMYRWFVSLPMNRRPWPAGQLAAALQQGWADVQQTPQLAHRLRQLHGGVPGN